MALTAGIAGNTQSHGYGFGVFAGVGAGILAGAQLAGFLGMLIALPVAAVIVVLLKYARECYEQSACYGLAPELITPPQDSQVAYAEAGAIDLATEKDQDSDSLNTPNTK